MFAGAIGTARELGAADAFGAWPAIVAASTGAATVMNGEKAADLIEQDS